MAEVIAVIILFFFNKILWLSEYIRNIIFLFDFFQCK